MHFTRPGDLVVAGLIGLAFAFFAFEFAYGALPQLPRLAGLTLAGLAVIEVALAIAIRSRIRDGRLTDAIGVVRAVVLAKASSVVGALMLGAWLGVLVALVPRMTEVSAAAEDVRSAIVGTASSAVLVAAALWLEQCCRTPDKGDQDRGDHPTG